MVYDGRDGVTVKTYQLRGDQWAPLNTRTYPDRVFHVVLDEQHGLLARFKGEVSL